MSIVYGPNVGLMAGAADGDLYGDAMRAFQRGVDALVMPNAKGYLTNTPPGSPSDGDLYIIGAAPTGAWAGKGGKVTRWSSVANAWEFYTPKNGWMIQSNSAREVYRRTGGAWEIYYQEGTWTPEWTDLAVTGSPVHSGSFTRNGRLVYWTSLINGNGGTTASAAGTTFINNLPFTVKSSAFCSSAQTGASFISYGTGSVPGAYSKAYTPTWSAYGGWISTSGTFII